MSDNLYATPEANLTEVTGDQKPILEFQRFSAWGVFFLTMITFGIYSMYWFVSRTKKANELSSHQVNLTIIYAYITCAVLGLVIPFLPFVNIVLYCLFIFKLRDSIAEIINKGRTHPVKLGGILTFFFNALYFQYKINEAIDIQGNK